MRLHITSLTQLPLGNGRTPVQRPLKALTKVLFSVKLFSADFWPDLSVLRYPDSKKKLFLEIARRVCVCVTVWEILSVLYFQN